MGIGSAHIHITGGDRVSAGIGVGLGFRLGFRLRLGLGLGIGIGIEIRDGREGSMNKAQGWG